MANMGSEMALIPFNGNWWIVVLNLSLYLVIRRDFFVENRRKLTFTVINIYFSGMPAMQLKRTVEFKAII